MLMSFGHSSVNAQKDSLALDAKQVCLQTDMTAYNRPDNTVSGWFDSFFLLLSCKHVRNNLKPPVATTIMSFPRALSTYRVSLQLLERRI